MEKDRTSIQPPLPPLPPPPTTYEMGLKLIEMGLDFLRMQPPYPQPFEKKAEDDT